MELTLDQAAAILRDQPFSRLLGTELKEFGGGKATLELRLEERHYQQHGVSHGGVVSYLVDTAITFAAGSAAGPGVVTSEIKVSYIAPGRGDALSATGRVVHHGRHLITVACDVFNLSAGAVTGSCAAALGTVYAGTASEVR